MKILRIDTEKEINREVKRIEITIGGINYVLTDEFSELKIHKSSGKRIDISPCVSNEIVIH